MPIKHSHDHGSFSWVDLVSRDMPAARAFYSKLFGWTSADLDTDGGTPYAQFSKNGKTVAGIGEMGDEMDQQGISPMWNSYIHVADINAVVHRAAELGAEITMPSCKFWKPVG